MGDKDSNKIRAEVLYLRPGGAEGDAETVEKFFSRIFHRFDSMKAETFLTGQERQKPYDLLILDCRGASRCTRLIRQLKTQKRIRDGKILIVYERDHPEIVTEMLAEGVHYFFPVPWTGETVHDVLRPLIEGILLPRRLRSCHHRLEECRRELGRLDVSGENTSCRDLGRRLETIESFSRLKIREMERHILEAMNMTALLAQGTLSEKQKEFLSRVEHSVSALKLVIDEFRDYFVTKGEGEGASQIFNLNSILESSSQRTAARFEMAEMDLVFDMDRSVPSRIRGNPVLLGQTLVNLFDSLVELDGGGEVILRISMDAGSAGSDEKFLNFELFHTGDFHTYVEDPMLFLRKNLLIREADRWIRKMGGRLTIGESPEKPILSFSLPIRQLDRRSYRLPSKEWMSKSMLIVDSNETSAQALEKMLRYFHFHVERVKDVRAALQELYNKSFDLIFVKEELFETFLREAISLKREAGLVLVTRDEEERRKKSDIADRVDLFLSLPFTQQKIFNLLLEYYAKERLEGEKEVLDILKENLIFLIGGKTALYLGHSGSNLLTIKGLLEEIQIVMLKSENLKQAKSLLGRVDLVFIDETWEGKEWEELLLFCQEECQHLPVFALLQEKESRQTDLLKIAGIENLISTPIDPEKFYRLLLDEMIERGL